MKRWRPQKSQEADRKPLANLDVLNKHFTSEEALLSSRILEQKKNLGNLDRGWNCVCMYKQLMKWKFKSNLKNEKTRKARVMIESPIRFSRAPPLLLKKTLQEQLMKGLKLLISLSVKKLPKSYLIKYSLQKEH